MPPKVLVGCPTAVYKEYCLDQYAKAATSLRYGRYDIIIVDNSPSEEYKKKLEETFSSYNKNNLKITILKGDHLEHAKERIVSSRNLIREYALERGFDYFLSLEQDVIPPKDIIERLLRHKKSVISGLYFTRYLTGDKKVIRPLAWARNNTGKLAFISDSRLRTFRLLQVEASGLGCVLIKKDIIAKHQFRLFDDKSTYDDMPFYYDLQKSGVPVFIDTQAICKHLIEGMDWDSIKE